MESENENAPWWTKRSKLEKGLLILGPLFGILLLVSILGFIYSSSNEVCTTEGCVRSAAEILNNIDDSVDPCIDFYQFACGKFISHTNLEYLQSKSLQSNVADGIQQQIKNLLEQPTTSESYHLSVAKKFYKSCMNTTAREKQGLVEIKQILKNIGGWPILESYWSGRLDFTEATHKLRKIGINFDLFIKLSVEKDKTDPNSHILVINSPSFSQSDVESIPLDYMVELAMEFGAEKNKATQQQQEVISMLRNIAKILEATVRDDKSIKMTISQMQQNITGINWLSYINGILAYDARLTSSDYVLVKQPEYLRKIIELLETTSKRVTANFICWYTIQYVVHHLPPKILDRVYHYARRLHHNVPKFENWQTCLKSTHSRFSLALSAVFVQHTYDQATRNKVLELTRNIKNQFKIAIKDLEWLDEASKEATREKIATSVDAIVSVNDIDDALSLDNIYREVEIDEDKYLDTVLRIDFLNTNLKYRKLKQTVRNTPWSCRRFPTGFDIDYSPRENTFRIPAGLLQGLYFRKDRPNYMNYGSLGSVVAHEISHIFTTAEYRNQDDLRDWWSMQSLAQYEENAQCLARQYATFYIPEIDKHLNSSNTRDEDIADLTGLKIAYEAYLRWEDYNNKEPVLPGLKYTSRQLFWIAAASRLCAKYTPYALEKIVRSSKVSPEKFRVNGPLRNLDYFSYDFSCSRDTYMNPTEKCYVW